MQPPVRTFHPQIQARQSQSTMDSQLTGVELASAWSTIIGTVMTAFSLTALLVVFYQVRVSRKLMSRAKSEEMLGPWRRVAASNPVAWFSATVPHISLPSLVKGANHFGPNFQYWSKRRGESGWVNFLGCMDLTPSGARCEPALKFYSTEKAMDLVEKRLPMRWNGGEFVCLCALLGFQQQNSLNRGRKYQFSALPLPALWSGPLGHLTLTASVSGPGLVASFRLRGYDKPAILSYPDADHEALITDLRIRACYAVHGLPSGDDRVLYFGGTRESEPKTMHSASTSQSNGVVLTELTIEPQQIYNTNDADLIRLWGLEHDKFMFLRFNKYDTSKHTEQPEVRIANFMIRGEALRAMSNSLSQLSPDGYIFTAHINLTKNLIRIFKHAFLGPIRRILKDIADFRNLKALSLKPVTNSALGAVSRLVDRYPRFEDLDEKNIGIRNSIVLALLVRDLRKGPPLHGSTEGARDPSPHIPIVGARDSTTRGRLRWALICSPGLVERLGAELERARRTGGLQALLSPESNATAGTVTGGVFRLSDERIEGHLDEQTAEAAPPALEPQQNEGFSVHNGCEDRPLSQPREDYTWLEVLDGLLDFVLTATWVTGGVMNNICYEALCVPENIFLI